MVSTNQTAAYEILKAELSNRWPAFVKRSVSTMRTLSSDKHWPAKQTQQILLLYFPSFIRLYFEILIVEVSTNVISYKTTFDYYVENEKRKSKRGRLCYFFFYSFCSVVQFISIIPSYFIVYVHLLLHSYYGTHTHVCGCDTFLYRQSRLWDCEIIILGPIV